MLELNEQDDDLVKAFYDNLPILKKDEVFLLIGGARKKYAKDDDAISTSHEVITRQILRYNDFNQFSQKLKKIQAYVALSTDKNTKKFFPRKSFVTWIFPNPRSTIKSFFSLQKRINEHLYQISNQTSEENTKQHLKQMKKIEIHYMSELQKNSARQLYNVCDIDIKSEQILSSLIYELQDYIKWVSETRGGYHILYEPRGNEVVYKRHLRALYGKQVEWLKDRGTAIWGVTQGGFKIQPVYWKEWL